MASATHKQAAYVIDRAVNLLGDPDHATWPRARLLQYLNHAQREVASHRPEAYIRVADIELNPGAEQTLPNDGKYLVDVVCGRVQENAEFIDGRAVRLTSREQIDTNSPAWRQHPNAVTEEFMYDERNPLHFDVYPPFVADGTTRKLKIEYAAVPDDVGVEADNICLSDEYIDPMTYWICRMAYSEETEAPEYKHNAEYFRVLFYETLQVQYQRLIADEPGSSPEERGARETDEVMPR